MAGAASSASAQFVTSAETPSAVSSSTSGEGNYQGYGRYYLSYNKIGMPDDGGHFNGVQLGAISGSPLLRQYPLYLEFGVAFQYAVWKEEYYNTTYKMWLGTIQIPINLAYKYAFNDKLAIAPYAGIDLKIHAVGNYKITSGDKSEKVDLFDKDEMEEWGMNSAKRFQIGWHIGVGMDISNCFLSISYGKDFNDFMKKTKLSNMLVTLGYTIR